MLLRPKQWYTVAESAEDLRHLIDHHLRAGTEFFQVHIEDSEGLQPLLIKYVREVAGEDMTRVSGTAGSLRATVEILFAHRDSGREPLGGRNLLMCLPEGGTDMVNLALVEENESHLKREDPDDQAQQ